MRRLHEEPPCTGEELQNPEGLVVITLRCTEKAEPSAKRLAQTTNLSLLNLFCVIASDGRSLASFPSKPAPSLTPCPYWEMVLTRSQALNNNFF